VSGLRFPRLFELAAERPERPRSGSLEAAWRRFAQAVVLEQQDRHDEAIVAFNAALAAAPGTGKTDDDVIAAELFAFGGAVQRRRGELADAHLSLVEAVRRWRHLGEVSRTKEAAGRLTAQLRAMGAALDPDGALIPLRPELWSGDAALDTARWLIATWGRERLVELRGRAIGEYARVLASLGNAAQARAECDEGIAWMRGATREFDDARYWLLMARGDIESLGGAVEASIETFAEARDLWQDHVVNVPDAQRVLIAEANRGNSLSRAGRFGEARAVYAAVLGQLEALGDRAAAAQVEYSDLFAALQQGERVDLEQLRRVIRDWEEPLREAPDAFNRFLAKRQLDPVYRMTLLALARDGGAAAAGDYLRVIRALREPERFADLPAGDEDVPVLDPVAVLDARLGALDATAVLVLAGAAGVMSVFVLAGGDGPLETRLCLATAGEAFTEHMAGLTLGQAEDLAAVATGRLPADHRAGAALERAGTALWDTIPERARRLILGAQTILYLPDTFGVLDELPVELLRHDGGWLGLTHVIARFPSPRTLAETLSPNRLPSVLGTSAYVLRADDPPGFDPLPSADAEAERVPRYLGLLGLDAERHDGGTGDEVRAALDAGHRVLHYVGHGLADRVSQESLVLSADESLQPRQLTQLDGFRTPFVYLSACDVGRARAVEGGRQRGIAVQLLEHGAPAVLACAQTVPDRVGARLAAAFYRHAAVDPVGLALLHARQALDAAGLAPSCWAVCVLHGDPAVTLATGLGPMRQTCQATASWASELVRSLATRSPERRATVSAACPAVDLDRLGDIPDALIEQVEAEDPLGGAALRMARALEDGSPHALQLGLAIAGDVADHLAIALFYGALARTTGAEIAPALRTLYAREAEAAAAGWAAASG
jgi:tetratricopeptide (TPR) repeat protein